MHHTTRWIAAAAITTAALAACSPAPEEAQRDSGYGQAPDALAGACDSYLETYNEVSAQAMDHFYKLYRAAGQSEERIESARDHWRFVGGTIEEAMLADEWASLTSWHRNLQDHLRSITVLSGENHYDFPEDAEAAVRMSERLEADYVRCMFARGVERAPADMP